MSAKSDADAAAQQRVIETLLGGGLVTDWRQRAYTDAGIHRLTDALLGLPPDDLRGKLVIAGFGSSAYQAESDPEIEQSCGTCMYFELHRRWCALPELNLPVEPQWSCVLWRV